MDDYVSIIEDEPAFLGLTFDAAFLFVVLLGRLEDGLGKRIQHAVAGAVAEHKIIGKRSDVFDVEKQDVFALSVLQGGDNFMCKFECVQISPHKVPQRLRVAELVQVSSQWLEFLSGAINNRV